MGSLFGKQKRPPSRVTQQDRAILQVKQQRDKLKLYQKKIVINLEKEREIAKKLLHEGKKERAKLILKKKRYQEQILQRTDGQLENMEQLVHDLEFAQVELQVVEGLKIGNESLKKIHEVLTVEEVEKILDETQEAVEKQQEIDALLSGVLTQEDESAVLEELDAIIKETMPAVPQDEEMEDDEMELPQLPNVPQDKLEVEKQAKRLKKREKVAAYS